MIFAFFAFYSRRTETDFKDRACTDCNSSRDKSFQKNSVLSNSTIYDCNWELLCARRLFETHTKAAGLLHIRLPLAVKNWSFLSFQAETISNFLDRSLQIVIILFIDYFQHKSSYLHGSKCHHCIINMICQNIRLYALLRLVASISKTCFFVPLLLILSRLLLKCEPLNLVSPPAI